MSKLLAIVLLILAILGVVGYKVYDGLVLEPGRKMAAAQKAKAPAQPNNETARYMRKEAEEVEPAIYVEEFAFVEDLRRFGYRGPARCRTDKGWYIVGEICRYGLVEEIRAPDLSLQYAVIKCRGVKQTNYVIAQESGVTASTATEEEARHEPSL